MEGKEAVAKAMKDLEELYNGIPDDSVDLTFKYLTSASDTQQNQIADPKDNEGMEPAVVKNSQELRKTPVASHDHNQRENADEYTNQNESSERHKQRKGIPHSNICALCSSYIHTFRHRCLVCGRVYCKKCVDMGMGKMTEGRKCKECLGKRFNQRYIKSAGKFGCCYGYPSLVKQQELIWAEKGPSINKDEKCSSGSQDPVTTINQQKSKTKSGPAFVMTASPGFYTGSKRLPLQQK